MAFSKQTKNFIADILSRGAWHPRSTLTLGRQTGMEFPCDAMDIHDADGANIIHDLNLPIGTNMQGRYQLIIDGGTLEHVYNVPQALENCRRMLRVGGWFVSHQLLNYAGHGFYGLSPELFWRWSECNGFTCQSCIAYSPLRPGVIRIIEVGKEREEFTTATHSYFLFRAQKATEAIGIPQQAAPLKPVSTLKQWFWRGRLWSRPKLRA